MTTEDTLYPATNLFDGKYATIGHSVQRNHPNGFNISIEFPSAYRISLIRVINRQNCCQERIIGFSVYIVNKIGSEVNCGSFTEAKSEYEFRREGVGDKVEIRKEVDVKMVNLGEVEIYGVLAAQCDNLDPNWNKVTPEPALPAPHGIKITLSCPADYTNKGGDKATCQDGTVVPTNQLPDCRAKCTIVNSNLDVIVADSELPAEDETEISYSCPRNQAKKGNDVKAGEVQGSFKNLY
ncbi:uncharacterized protein LOC134816811 [Bolinopsis microptera]|uniref:uncharacterized protein LOC134816811 n=1 Tax=Bolinopsis microptera TaxID=2820187 RepID=UPI00307AE9D6